MVTKKKTAQEAQTSTPSTIDAKTALALSRKLYQQLEALVGDSQASDIDPVLAMQLERLQADDVLLTVDAQLFCGQKMVRRVQLSVPMLSLMDPDALGEAPEKFQAMFTQAVLRPLRVEFFKELQNRSADPLGEEPMDLLSQRTGAPLGIAG